MAAPDLSVRPEAIRAVLSLPQGGTVIMSAFPGLTSTPDGTAVIDPGDQSETLFAMADGGADTLMVLTETDELPSEAMDLLGQTARAAGLDLIHNPIEDFGVPSDAFMDLWAETSTKRNARLASGGTIAVCCQYGAGRSGLIASLLHIEGGLSASDAIAKVREAFSEAVESPAQEQWLSEQG